MDVAEERREDHGHRTRLSVAVAFGEQATFAEHEPVRALQRDEDVVIMNGYDRRLARRSCVAP
jgi:hypothetical protein